MAAYREHVVQPGLPGHRRAFVSLKHQLRILHVIAGAEFKLKYADSALGYVWSVAKPMALFSVLYVIFGRFLGQSKTVPHYPIYLLLGIVLWTFFVDATAITLTSIVAAGHAAAQAHLPAAYRADVDDAHVGDHPLGQPDSARDPDRVEPVGPRAPLAPPRSALARALRLHPRRRVDSRHPVRALPRRWAGVGTRDTSPVLRDADHHPRRRPAAVVAADSSSSTRSCRSCRRCVSS